MSKPKPSPLPKTIEYLGWILFLAFCGFIAYTCWDYYKSYSAGYALGVKQGNVFAQRIRSENLRHGTRTNEEKKFIEEKTGRMKQKTWREQIYVHGWESGLHSVIDLIPR